MKDWLEALKDCYQAGRPSALVTIADARGSAPREAGVKMLVTAEGSAGTVGGGNLEYEAIRIARTMLEDGLERSHLRQFALGPSLGQCCGGNTKLLFDPIIPNKDTSPPAWIDGLISLQGSSVPSMLISAVERTGAEKLIVTPDQIIGRPARPARAGADLDLEPDLMEPDLMEPDLIEYARDVLDQPGKASASLWRSGTGELYFLERNPESQGDVLLIGAGHVGKALAQVLASLPFRVTWTDNRPEQFPEDIAGTIQVHCTPHLENVVDEAKAGTIFLVMTYSHDLDYALCARILQRGDFRYLGLIGSKTKRARFEKTMADLGIDQTLTNRVVCPIGIPGINSKQPSVIAISTAAELLALPPTRPKATDRDPG